MKLVTKIEIFAWYVELIVHEYPTWWFLVEISTYSLITSSSVYSYAQMLLFSWNKQQIAAVQFQKICKKTSLASLLRNFRIQAKVLDVLLSFSPLSN